MNPKEKAKELQAKMMVKINDRFRVGNTIQLDEAAKGCVKVLVEEILWLGVGWFDPQLVGKDDIEEKDTEEFWQEVQQEIERL